MNLTKSTMRSIRVRMGRSQLPCFLAVLLAVPGLAHASASAPDSGLTPPHHS